MNGGFSPLTGFMNEETYNSVVSDMKLPGGLMMGLPVVFDTDDEDLAPGDVVLLKDGEREIATVEFTDKYKVRAQTKPIRIHSTPSSTPNPNPTLS